MFRNLFCLTKRWLVLLPLLSSGWPNADLHYSKKKKKQFACYQSWKTFFLQYRRTRTHERKKYSDKGKLFIHIYSLLSLKFSANPFSKIKPKSSLVRRNHLDLYILKHKSAALETFTVCMYLKVYTNITIHYIERRKHRRNSGRQRQRKVILLSSSSRIRELVSLASRYYYRAALCKFSNYEIPRIKLNTK